MRPDLRSTIATLGGLALAASAIAAGPSDFGLWVDAQLKSHTLALYGFGKPLVAPAGPADVVPRELATAEQRQLLAQGLKAEYVARNVANLGDMISFWPDATLPTHLMVCIEQARSGVTPAGNGGLNPSVQRVELATGAVENILHGMSRCDGIRTTPWGTVVATEEQVDGRAYEILDPLGTDHHWVASRLTGDVRDGIDSPGASASVVQRPALGSFAWEGVAVLPTGVVLAGDELRPSGGAAGGAIFKFLPEFPRDPLAGPIGSLADSPFVSGTLYALRVGGSDFGQGNQRGAGKWIGPVATVDPSLGDSSSEWAVANGATGFYRPEDLHDDPFFAGPGVRVVWNNTGNSGQKNWAETLTLVDPDPASASSAPVVQTFVEGNDRFSSADNLDIQPKRGNVYVIEDDTWGEVWSCLPDGADENLMSDGCVSMLSVRDPDAEPTGFIFDASGKTAYYIVQHGQQPPGLLDFASNPVNGRTDDLVRITGFHLQP